MNRKLVSPLSLPPTVHPNSKSNMTSGINVSLWCLALIRLLHCRLSWKHPLKNDLYRCFDVFSFFFIPDLLPIRETRRSKGRFWEVHILKRLLHPGKDTARLLHLQVRCSPAVSYLSARSSGYVAENCGDLSRISGCAQSLCAGLLEI